MTVFLIKTSVFSLFFHVKWSYDPVSQVFPVESGIFSSKKYPFFIICQLTNSALSVILYTEPNHGKQKGGNNMNWAYTILWVVLMVVFLVVEAACPFHLVSIWFAVGSLVASIVAALGGQLYYLDENGRMMAVRGNAEAGAALEDAFDWYAETGDMLVNMPDNKYVSRIQIRAGVEKGSKLRLEAQYDSRGEWTTIMDKTYTKKASFTAPIIPMRCDHVRLRISGVGRSCVYAISKEIERGSEI
jgi:hypothetical protein